MNNQDDIIDLAEGYGKVQKQGIEPFINFIETGQREFFKAKDFVTLYDLIFKMCIQRDPYNWSEAMYERYTHAILNYLLTKVAPAFETVKKTSDDKAFLTEWKTRWNNQKLIVKGLSKLFMYLDRFYTPNTDGILELKEQGFKLYKENIFDTFGPFARQAILNAIEKERNAEDQDRLLLQEAVNVFVEMGQKYGNKKLKVYKSDLEQYIVEHAGLFYKRKSRMWMDQDSCPNYLEKAEKMLQAESNRVKSYLHHSTDEPLGRECYVQLLKTHQKEVLSKKTGVFHLLSVNLTEDLSRLYRLFSRGDSNSSDLVPIADMVHEHIKKEGSEIVDNAKAGGAAPAGPPGAAAAPAPAAGAAAAADANHSLVKNLIALHAQYNKVVTDCFGKAQVFQKALKKAFEDFINKDNRVSKLLAKFVNDVLKKGTKVNIKDVESTLDNIVFLYGYIQEKDIFERDYQTYLATRLLMGQCESEHSEKSMIAKLKTECGYQWTNKLEGMFKDVSLSKDLGRKFQLHYDTEKEMDMSFEVNVCTTGYWPAGKATRCTIPPDIVKACDKYRAFYLNQHSGHKLEWRMDQGQAECKVAFAPKLARTLVCSTYQMMILLVFNAQRIVTFKEILDMTGIPKFEIANHLLSLAHPKVNVLQKRPNSKDLNDTDKFMLNPKYTSQLMKVQIPLLKATVNEKEDEHETKIIELQRRHQMDAAIVRIMKTRKTLRHALLVAEVIQQLSARFRPKPNFIKKRIEALIEQEYLERDANDRGVYNYLA